MLMYRVIHLATKCTLMCSSASFLAEISVGTPRKCMYFHYIFSGYKYPKNLKLSFDKGSTDVQMKKMRMMRTMTRRTTTRTMKQTLTWP